ncbi:hypothetical protein [Paenibacillus graminis]|uniref:hypothetical protein n=1 Tax=Paenibacillus graminis TaxID=189425 RepID=UPI002DB8B263|nr:hypothetical protein [Paenibacillus graminis]MEC0167899.1 hypothetical protein [Paenibacillus graminis]
MSYKDVKKKLPKTRLLSEHNPAERISHDGGDTGGGPPEDLNPGGGGNPGDDGDR